MGVRMGEAHGEKSCNEFVFILFMDRPVAIHFYPFSCSIRLTHLDRR